MDTLRSFNSKCTVEEAKSISQELLKFSRDKFGVGAAAPQIGINKRVFVVDYKGTTFTCINPELLSKSSNKTIMPEGCLSCGDIGVFVKRSESVLLRYTDLNGDKQVKHFSGYIARIIQHEIDHLNGKLIVDYIK